ncbi:hypothetical protein M5689_018933 [Euphorbia peplus]|nr:hypothetical protein M5689_018933 [Euphorbia peplus]
MALPAWCLRSLDWDSSGIWMAPPFWFENFALPNSFISCMVLGSLSNLKLGKMSCLLTLIKGPPTILGIFLLSYDPDKHKLMMTG